MASFSSALQSASSATSLFCVSSRTSSCRSNGVPLSFRRLQTSRLRFRCEAKPDTVDRVMKIVTKKLATKEGLVKPESKFSDLGADSLDQVEIVMALEEEFSITVDEDGAEAISTVRDAAELIDKIVSKA